MMNSRPSELSPTPNSVYSSQVRTGKYRRNGQLQSCEPCRKSKLRCDRKQAGTSMYNSQRGTNSECCRCRPHMSEVHQEKAWRSVCLSLEPSRQGLCRDFPPLFLLVTTILEYVRWGNMKPANDLLRAVNRRERNC